MTVAELTDQNTPVQIKRLPPAELQARASAYEDMGVLLAKAQAKPSSEWPLYKLVAKAQLLSKDVGPHIVDPMVSIGKNEWAQVTIRHAGIPNLTMRPVDKTAEAIFKKWIKYIGGSEAANRLAPKSPAWATDGGTLIMSSGRGATQTAREHGRVFEVEPIVIDGEDIAARTARENGELTEEQMIPNDPRRTKINVLGTLAAPATTGMTSARTV